MSPGGLFQFGTALRRSTAFERLLTPNLQVKYDARRLRRIRRRGGRRNQTCREARTIASVWRGWYIARAHFLDL
jgi:hypothetical protein